MQDETNSLYPPKRQARLLLALLLAVLFDLNCYPTSAGENKTLKAGISVAQVLDSYGLTVSGNSLPTKITAIKLGTPAAESGLREGDEVQQITPTSFNLTVRIRRGKMIYQAKMTPPSPPDVSSRDDVYVAPEKIFTNEAWRVTVSADIAFCNNKDNPNWSWLRREQQDPRLSDDWQSWISDIESLVSQAVKSRVNNAPKVGNAAPHSFQYHISIHYHSPVASPLIEITPFRREYGDPVRLIPLLKSLSPKFGKFPARSKTNTVHVLITVEMPCVLKA